MNFFKISIFIGIFFAGLYIYLSLKNNNICHSGFISFKNHGSIYCVAKYEMKKSQESGMAISIAQQKPWTEITYKEAIESCKKLGEGYSLLTNSVWTNLANNIARNPRNWSSKSEYFGSLNIGHSFNKPNFSLEASSNDNNSCFGLPIDCSSEVWRLRRRTHELKGGEIIWDFAGNVSEYVQDSTAELKLKEFGFFAFTDLKNDTIVSFGPEYHCDNTKLENFYCGFGSYINSLAQSHQVGTRGGEFNSKEPLRNGIFTISQRNKIDGKSKNIGSLD